MLQCAAPRCYNLQHCCLFTFIAVVIVTAMLGLTVIRSHDMELMWAKEFETAQNAHSRAVFLWVSLGRWLSVRIDCIVYIFSVCTIFASCFVRDTLPA